MVDKTPLSPASPAPGAGAYGASQREACSAIGIYSDRGIDPTRAESNLDDREDVRRCSATKDHAHPALRSSASAERRSSGVWSDMARLLVMSVAASAGRTRDWRAVSCAVGMRRGQPTRSRALKDLLLGISQGRFSDATSIPASSAPQDLMASRDVSVLCRRGAVVGQSGWRHMLVDEPQRVGGSNRQRRVLAPMLPRCLHLDNGSIRCNMTSQLGIARLVAAKGRATIDPPFHSSAWVAP